jgi:hypothetical protein
MFKVCVAMVLRQGIVLCKWKHCSLRKGCWDLVLLSYIYHLLHPGGLFLQLRMRNYELRD